MSKFGELIESSIPVLLHFCDEENLICQEMNIVLQAVATDFGDKARIVKIDIDKNKELSEALKIKDVPTHIIYLNGEMKWRQTGMQTSNDLIGILQEYC